MLIVPAEHRFDLARLPYATLLLVLVCVFVYGFYQSNDAERVEAALATYQQENLNAWEAPLLEAWCAQQADCAPEAIADARGAAELALASGFDAEVHRYWNSTEPAADWAAARARFEAARDRISWYRFGLEPAAPRPSALLAHMFLHGDIAHLIGNMIFLVLFGLLLERLLGSLLFFASFIVTGLAAAGVYLLAHAGSHVPMIGASGAIAGLMGAYLGVYGLRRVRFFYTIGFWFGEFTAPAILIFPLWLGKELYGWFQGTELVAYAAHAGGLLGGLLLASLLRKPAAAALNVDDDTRRRQGEREQTLLKIRRLLTDLRVDDALRAAEQAVRQTPGEFAYWEIYAEASERMVAPAAYERAVSMLFLNATHKALPADFLREQLKRYQARSETQALLKGKAGATLAQRFFRDGAMRDVDQLLDAQFRRSGLGAAHAELLRVLLQFAEKNADRRRMQRYRQYLEAMPPAAAAGVPSQES